jgi:hypothetical protein
MIAAAKALLFGVLMSIGTTALAQSYSFPIGRLFLTPEQRRTLDAKPRGVDPGAQSNPANAIAANTNGRADGDRKTTESADVRLDGWLRRSDGVTTIWLNGQPLTASGDHSAAAASGARLVDDQVLVRDAAGRSRRLPVGPQIDADLAGSK